MDLGPRYALRLSALALASAPMLHQILSPVRGRRFEPFCDLREIETMFESAPVAWLLCLLLPCVASVPAWRPAGWTSGFTFATYLGLLVSLLGSRSAAAITVALAAGAAFVALLILARIEIEVAAAWARICLAGCLIVACGRELFRHPEPTAGLIGLAIGAVLMGGGEIWALRMVSPEPETGD